MAKKENFKILAQSNPAATTYTDIFTGSSSAQYIVSTITVANLSATEGTFRIAIKENGEALSNKQFIAYNVPVPGFDSISLTLGLTISDFDLITVYASTASVAFGVFGSEIL